MPLTQSQINVTATWKQIKTNSAFSDTVQGSDNTGLSTNPSISTYNHVFLTDGTLAGSATTTLDLYSFTNKVGEAVTATKLLGLLVKVTGSGSVLKVEPGATNPITKWFGGTTPSLSITPSSGTAVMALVDGTHTTLSTTARNLKLTNTGGSTATYEVYALVGV